MYVPILEECLDLRKRINGIIEKVYELDMKARAPKAQPFTDMPHATSRSNAIENYILQKEKLNEKRHGMEIKLDESWSRAHKAFKDAGATAQEIDLLRLRFFYGKSWKECTSIMQKIYGKWNENASFRAYRKAVARLRNAKEKFVHSAN